MVPKLKPIETFQTVLAIFRFQCFPRDSNLFSVMMMDKLTTLFPLTLHYATVLILLYHPRSDPSDPKNGLITDKLFTVNTTFLPLLWSTGEASSPHKINHPHPRMFLGCMNENWYSTINLRKRTLSSLIRLQYRWPKREEYTHKITSNSFYKKGNTKRTKKEPTSLLLHRNKGNEIIPDPNLLHCTIHNSPDFPL